LLQMINHGVSTGALFLLVGMIYQRRHTRMIDELGGLQKAAPIMAGVFMLVMLSSIGLPGLNGFVGEFLIILGVFRVSPMFAALAALGVIISAMYMLRAYQRVFFGVPKGANSKLKDLCPREIIAFLPLAALVLVLGFFPNILLDKISANVEFTVHTSSLPHLQSKAELSREQLTGQEVSELAPVEQPGVSSSPVEEQSSQPDVKTINRENSSDHT
jgi:NADH-quinone oxidoreductase subunit M